MYFDRIPHYPLSHPLFITCVKLFKCIYLFVWGRMRVMACVQRVSLLPCGP